jgi:hypothetical protein
VRAREREQKVHVEKRGKNRGKNSHWAQPFVIALLRDPTRLASVRASLLTLGLLRHSSMLSRGLLACTLATLSLQSWAVPNLLTQPAPEPALRRCASFFHRAGV